MLDDDDDYPDALAPRMTGDFSAATTALTRLLHRLNALKGDKDGLIDELGYIEAGIKQAESGRVAAEKTVERLQGQLDEARDHAAALAATAKRVEVLQRELDDERRKRAALANAQPPAPTLPPLLVGVFDNPPRLAAMVAGVALATALLAGLLAAVFAGGSEDELARLARNQGQILAKLEEQRRPVMRLGEAMEVGPRGGADSEGAAEDGAADDEGARDEDGPDELALEEPDEPAAAQDAPPAGDERFVVVHSSSPSRAEALKVRDRALRYLASRERGARVCLTTPEDGRMLIFFTTPEGFTKKDAIIWAYKLSTTRASGTQFAFPDRMPPAANVTDCVPEG